MIELPALKPLTSSMDGVNGFTGYNHGMRINSTEFFDQKNVTGEYLPVIRSRHTRGILRKLEKANGLFANDKLGWVDGTTLYYNGEAVGTVTDTEKKVMRMGANIVIWPDKVYYNTRTGEFGPLEAHYVSAGAVSAVLCRSDGNVYSSYTASSTAPDAPENGDYWLDISGEASILKQYSTSLSMWTTIQTVYVKIIAPGIGADFSQYDSVTIAGMDNAALNGDFFLTARGEDWIVVTAVIAQAIAVNSVPVSVDRYTPDMEYITESNNRLWGCNSANNEIYACALGDAKNWYQYRGISTDSYAVTVGSAGPFTGAATHLGNVFFFKEHIIHQILGTIPSNFTLSDTGARGVSQGSGKSLCVVNEVLYYRAINDVCAFAQSLPNGISAALGNETYRNAVAGAWGRYYYICMEKENGEHLLFVYDTENQTWSKEDNLNVRWFVQLGGELYFIADNILYSARGTLDEYGDAGKALEGPIEWMLETGDIGTENPYTKYISGIQLSVDLALGSSMKVLIQYNGFGAWTEIYHTAVIRPQNMVLPITTKRCRTVKLRIQGKGEFSLFSIAKRISAGSDKYEI